MIVSMRIRVIGSLDMREFSRINPFGLSFRIKSHIDNRPLDGVPSIRVHNGTDYSGTSARLIRWTEVFILQVDFHYSLLFHPSKNLILACTF
jgi:hypothetical protein